MKNEVKTFEEILAKDGKLVYKTRGVSMKPMLKQERDIVVIEAVTAPLKPLDVAFYKRGEQYVLHRVIACLENEYLIRGDNTYVVERVPCDAVLGVLISFKRKGKDIFVENAWYKKYARLWTSIYPVRFIYAKAKRLAVRVVRYVKRLGRRKSV